MFIFNEYFCTGNGVYFGLTIRLHRGHKSSYWGFSAYTDNDPKATLVYDLQINYKYGDFYAIYYNSFSLSLFIEEIQPNLYETSTNEFHLNHEGANHTLKAGLPKQKPITGTSVRRLSGMLTTTQLRELAVGRYRVICI